MQRFDKWVWGGFLAVAGAAFWRWTVSGLDAPAVVLIVFAAMAFTWALRGSLDRDTVKRALADEDKAKKDRDRAENVLERLRRDYETVLANQDDVRGKIDALVKKQDGIEYRLSHSAATISVQISPLVREARLALDSLFSATTSTTASILAMGTTISGAQLNPVIIPSSIQGFTPP